MTARPLIILLAYAALGIATPAASQDSDTARVDTLVDVRSLLRERANQLSWLAVKSGKTYNRVEGMPMLLGPMVRASVGTARLTVTALGILRTAHGLHWDSENLGHRVTTEASFGGSRGIRVIGETFDLVAPVERWQLPEPDAGLAAFFLKRDYLDHYGRHGGRLALSAFAGADALVELGLSDERWSTRRERDVFTLTRGDENWRINPPVDNGRMHLADIAVRVDTRNAEHNPWAGWYLDLEYERGSGALVRQSGVLLPAATETPERVSYGRAFLDVRRYSRISPRTQLNARVVLGGWLHGDQLPLQRRFSVGGIGTIPGFEFRRTSIGTDVGQCATASSTIPGRPAQCERVSLVQLEYRNELIADLIEILARNRIRARGALLSARPSIVVFVDAGRGWLVGPRAGTLTYPSGALPPLGSYRSDVGVGLDAGAFGFYVAKALSAPKEPANFFVRLRNRF